MSEHDLMDEILKNISLSGAASEENAQQKQIVLGSRNNLNHIINLSAGTPRIRQNVEKRFSLILRTPVLLSALSPFEIRCCLCRRVVSYPAWYYSLQYAINHFHYFVCFDSSSKMKPTTRCYKRS